MADAEVASVAVAAGILRHAYPQVIQHLRTHQQGGHQTVLLSGNIHPMLFALGGQLKSAIIATTMEASRGVYTGNVVGEVCVLEGKRRKMLHALNPVQLSRTAAERSGLVGVGNSVYDVPFLSEVPPKSAWVVRPSKRLRRVSDQRGWDTSFASVRGSGTNSQEYSMY